MILATLLLASTGEMTGELGVAKEGEKIVVNLGVLRELLPKDLTPDKPVGFVVTCRGTKTQATDWFMDIMDVRPGDDITIEHDPIELKIVLSVKAADGRRASAKEFSNWDRKLLAVSVCDGGQGDWSIAADKGYEFTTKGEVRMNELILSQLEPVVKASKGAAYFMQAGVTHSPLQVATRFFEVMIEGSKCADEKERRKVYLEKFVPLWNANDRAKGEGNNMCQMQWTAALNVIKRRGLKGYKYSGVEPKGTGVGRRAFYFERLRKTGEDSGHARIVIELEDRWVVSSSTNE